MMEEDKNFPADYAKGFNEGYIIAKHKPDLAEKLAAAVGESDRGLGFKDGREQLMLDLVREKRPKWLTRDLDSPPNTPDMEKNIEKDKDIERD